MANRKNVARALEKNNPFPVQVKLWDRIYEKGDLRSAAKAIGKNEEERQVEIHERGGDAQEYLRCVLCKRAISKLIDDRRRYNGKSKECCPCAGKEQSIPGASEAVGSDL